MRRILCSGLKAALAFLLVAMALLVPNEAGPRAHASDSCADFDGDGFVHLPDFVILLGPDDPWWPPDPRLDVEPKGGDGDIDIRDAQFVFGRLDFAVSCQTNPIATTTVDAGALAVDASGESTAAGDPVESKRPALVGVPFQVSVQLTDNPGISGYQAQLHWDEALLDLAPDPAGNDVWGDAEPSVAAVQVSGPADDGAGSDAYTELAAALFGYPAMTSMYLGPVAQFEFTCQAEGTARIVLTGADGHTALARVAAATYTPATAYVPTLSDAEVHCLTALPDPSTDSDGDGCRDVLELGANPAQGGRRDRNSFWDFMDQFTGSPPAKDQTVSIGDVGAVVRRFGASGDPSGDPLLPPADMPGYHPSADRNGVIPGGDPWDLLPPDGVIAVGDIGAAVAQFGHRCA